jgi:hypothetical protein
MPLQATSGTASYDAFGGGVAAVPNYIEDVFSTYLYTGTGSGLTITNGIDLSTKGGMVWQKSRSAAGQNFIFDTSRGALQYLSSNSTNASANYNESLTAFNTTGFTLGFNLSNSGETDATWTFRKQPKFFDVVTWTGDGTGNRTIPHNLGSTPGFITTKRTNTTSNWVSYHRAVTTPNANWWRNYGYLDLTDSFIDFGSDAGLSQAPDANNIYVGSYFNASGTNYVFYVFAHNAGGFGLSGTDNVITCGSYTTNSSAVATVDLGYEPQWVLAKSASSGSDSAWFITDNMRGFFAAGGDASRGLRPNSTAAEIGDSFQLTSTGFKDNGTLYSSATCIYIAIRRGPMKVPTDATTVFQPLTRSGTGGATTVTSTVRPDTLLQNWRSGGLGSADHFMYDRLRGVAKALFTDTTDAESTQTATGINAFNNLSYGMAGAGSMNNGSALYVDYVFTRAPSFFDEVCYTGTGSGTSQTHNLGVIPELKIIKNRSASYDWVVGGSIISGVGGRADSIILNSTAATVTNSTYWATSDTSTTFSVRAGNNSSDASGSTYVAYLFATCAGVSKVGSYTGTGTTQAINCGFTAGARFVLIKKTSGTGSWYVWDSARGIVSGNDPYLLLNSTAAEVTNTDYIDTYSAGFEISSTAPSEINENGGSFIFFAVA